MDKNKDFRFSPKLRLKEKRDTRIKEILEGLESLDFLKEFDFGTYLELRSVERINGELDPLTRGHQGFEFDR